MGGFAMLASATLPGTKLQAARPGAAYSTRPRFQRAMAMGSNKDFGSKQQKKQQKRSGFQDSIQGLLRLLGQNKEASSPKTPAKPKTPGKSGMSVTAAAKKAAEAEKAVVEAAKTEEVTKAEPEKKNSLSSVQQLLTNNRYWAEKINSEKSDFFEDLAKGQSPEFFWVGCADSRVVTNFFTGTGPGDVFCHRNVGNIVMHTDMNCMSALEYSVGHLKVKHVVVCGHYGCGAVNAALTLPQKSEGIVNAWISKIRDVRNEYAKVLQQLDEPDRWPKLCEANAVEQAFNACTAPVVQAAWAEGQELYVHAMIFDIATGRLKRLAGPISSIEQAVYAEEAFLDHGGGEEIADGLVDTGVKKELHAKIVRALSGVKSFEDKM